MCRGSGLEAHLKAGVDIWQEWGALGRGLERELQRGPQASHSQPGSTGPCTPGLTAITKTRSLLLLCQLPL